MPFPLTFETKCYEYDWKFLLKAGRLKKMIEYCDYPFTERILYINNVNDLNLVKKYADKCVNKNIIDSYIVVEEHTGKVLKAFNIDANSFNGGYYYSIQELVGIYLCKTDYLLHFSGDSLMRLREPWIDDAIIAMKNNPRFFLANPQMSKNVLEAKEESFDEDKLFYYSYGFSDQCYLINVNNYRGDIYNESHPASERYPKYGGDLFEKRLDSYLRNHNLYRLTSKKSAYRHRNFPKYKWKRWLWINLGIKIE
jgi:hypothetical protein